MSRVISYAQNREDIILAAFFRDRKKGFYVDVGANHPLHDSVTKLFYDRGWTGINVEPSRQLYQLLCEDRPRDINLNIGLSDHPGKSVLREYEAPGYSTFAEEMKREHAGHPRPDTKNFHDYEVEIDTLAHILEQQKAETIQFMKIDVEGYEYAVLKGNNWAKYRPEIICIEANHIYHDWREMLAKQDYEEAFFDGLNAYYVAKEHIKLKDQFSYAEQIVLGPRVISWGLQNEINELVETNEQLQIELEESNTANELLTEERAQLQADIDHKRIRHQVRDLLGNVDFAIRGHIEALGRTGELPPPSKIVLSDLPQDASPSLLIMHARRLDVATPPPRISLRRTIFLVVKSSYYFLRWFVRRAFYVLRLFLAKIRSLLKSRRQP